MRKSSRECQWSPRWKIAGSFPATCKNEFVLILSSACVRMRASHRQDVFSKRRWKCCPGLNLLSSSCFSRSCDLSTVSSVLLSLQRSHGCCSSDSFSHITSGGDIYADVGRWSVKTHWSCALSISAFLSALSPVLWLVFKTTLQSKRQGRADSTVTDNRFLHKPVFRRPAWMHHGQGEPFYNKVIVFKKAI